MDPKKRITIPSDWRSGEAESFFLRVDSTGSCIHVMPPEEFRRKKELFASLPGVSVREQQIAVRQFSADSLICSADKQGRMVIPPEYCARIALQGEVVLVGVSDRFEIWNPARWEATKAANDSVYQNFANQLGL